MAISIVILIPGERPRRQTNSSVWCKWKL